MIRDATPAEIRTYFKGQHKTVLTLLGYSAADYEDKAALIAHATEILERADPRTTIVNIGATPDGIGVVYELAKKKGFTTSGIVSTQARESKAPFPRASTSCSSSRTRRGADSSRGPSVSRRLDGDGRGERSARRYRRRRRGQG